MPNMAQPAGEWVRAQDIQQDIDFACTSCRYVYIIWIKEIIVKMMKNRNTNFDIYEIYMLLLV